jgi:hypothetical protein
MDFIRNVDRLAKILESKIFQTLVNNLFSGLFDYHMFHDKRKSFLLLVGIVVACCHKPFTIKSFRSLDNETDCFAPNLVPATRSIRLCTSRNFTTKAWVHLCLRYFLGANSAVSLSKLE